jgi:hypothetical protein
MESGAAEVIGEHDNPTDDPHCHYSILTIEHRRVVNVDWGYHTEDEAREHLPPASDEHYRVEVIDGQVYLMVRVGMVGLGHWQRHSKQPDVGTAEQVKRSLLADMADDLERNEAWKED